MYFAVFFAIRIITRRSVKIEKSAYRSLERHSWRVTVAPETSHESRLRALEGYQPTIQKALQGSKPRQGSSWKERKWTISSPLKVHWFSLKKKIELVATPSEPPAWTRDGHSQLSGGKEVGHGVRPRADQIQRPSLHLLGQAEVIPTRVRGRYRKLQKTVKNKGEN